VGPQTDLVDHHRRHRDGVAHDRALSGASCSSTARISSRFRVARATSSSIFAMSSRVLSGLAWRSLLRVAGPGAVSGAVAH
jgi:hypothetical protein